MTGPQGAEHLAEAPCACGGFARQQCAHTSGPHSPCAQRAAALGDADAGPYSPDSRHPRPAQGGGGPGSTGHLFTATARGLGLTLGPQCLDVAWLLLQWASAWLPQPEHSGKGTDGTSQVLSSPTGTQEGPLFHSQGNLLGG